MTLCTGTSLALALLVASPDYGAMTTSTRKLLSDLVAADTSNPPGNEARAVAIGAARLKDAGIPFEVTDFAPGRQNLVARLKGEGSEKPLLLLAHVDVVGASGQQWSTDPHKVTAVDGYLVGRGVSDDLGMASVNLAVFMELKKQGVRLRRDVILAWTGDEESGGAGIRWLLEHQRASIDAGLALNEGGGLVLGPDGKVKLVTLQAAEKAYQDFAVSARGTTGHSSVPLEDNAIYRLARGLDRLGRHVFPPRVLPVTRAYFAQRAGVESPRIGRAMRALAAAKGSLPQDALELLSEDPVMSANLRTTCVVTTVEGGTRANALPAEAHANVNCRILPDESPEDVRRQLVAVFDDPELDVKATAEFGSAGASDPDGEGPAAVRKVMSELWPGAPVVPFMSRGATDSRFLRAVGIPSYGINPIANAELDSRRAHGVDERFPEASLRPGVELMYRLVLELAAKR